MDLKNKIFISYGTDKYDPSRIKQIEVDSKWSKVHNKPHGGLWASPVDSSFSWGDFCNREAFNLKSLNKHFIFKLKPNSKICVIDNINDLIKYSSFDNYLGMHTLYIKKIVSLFDGLYVSDNAVVELRHIDLKLRLNGLDSWDIESICIWNPDIVEPIEENAFEKASHHKYEKPLYSSDEEEYYWGYDNLDDRKKLQIDADFERYRNTNVDDSRKLFKGEHPALLAQKHGNSKDAKLARKFNGTIKSGMNENKSNNMNNNMIKLTESDLHKIIKESVNKILNEISYGVAKSAYDKMRDLGQYERANNLERTFKTVNDEEDAIYNLNRDSLELRGDTDSIMTKDNSIGRPATRYMRNKSGSINNQDIEYSRDRNHPKGEYDYYKPSHEGEVNGYIPRLTNNPKSARRFAKHANNFAGITKYDKNNFRK